MAKKSQLNITQFDVINDRDKAVYFKMSKADQDKFYRYSCIVETYITRKRPIPLQLYKRLMNLFVPLDNEIESEYTELFLSKITQVRSRFLNEKNYEFSYKNKKTKQEYNLSEMLDACLHHTLGHHLIEQPDKKDFCIKTSYQAMQNYLNELPIKYQKFISHYKLSSIAGFIAIVLGHELNKDISEIIRSGELPTNSEIFHAVDNITKKLKIKERKK